MNNTEHKIETEEELKERLLAEYKKKQEEEEAKRSSREREKKELHNKYVKMFDTLKVPHSDIVIIRNLHFKRTLVGVFDRVYAFKYLKNLDFRYPCVEKCRDFAYIENSSRSLEERISHTGHPTYYRFGIDEMNDNFNYLRDAYVSGDEKVHIFYDDSATLCPFCGDLSRDKNEESDQDYFSDTYLNSLRTQGIFYKRCSDHDKMSRKDYLHSWEAVTKNGLLDKVEKSYLEILQESVYPSPIKHDREYFKKKKERKAKKSVKKSLDSVKGLYKKRGFYYWQPPQKDGVRPKAIALRTKDESEVLERLDEIKEEFELVEYIEPGNVYLMKSDLNGRIKIGRTKDKPVYRERTLQSQEPEVSLIFHRKVSDMRETERYLHVLFASKRFRGEWFDLSKEDIEEAKSIIERASNG